MRAKTHNINNINITNMPLENTQIGMFKTAI